MNESRLIQLLEETTGLELNEKRLTGLIDGRLQRLLKAADPKRISLGAASGPELGFSRFLGQIRRLGLGQAEDAQTLGLARVDPGRVKDLREGATTAGGYLAPAEQATEVLNQVRKYSVIRSLCRVVPMRGHQINFPTVAGGVTAYWVPEATDTATHGLGDGQEYGEVPRSETAFGQLPLSAHVLAVKVVVSNQLLDDSDPAVDQVLLELFAEAIGQAFDVACLRGAGTATDPIKGLTELVTTNVLDAAGVLDFDQVSRLVFAVYEHAPHVAQVPILGHPKAEKLLMQLKDDHGDYIYRQPGMPRGEAQAQPTIWGEPFHRDPNILTNLGDDTNQTRLFAGDFAQSALVGERQGLVVKTNPYAEPYFSYNQTCFLAECRLGFALADQKRFAVLSAVPTTAPAAA